MHPAHDAATRWPALDVEARRGRLRQTVHLSPGPVSGPVMAMQAAARQAAEGLWRREAAVWSRDEAVQRQIAGRLGWLASPRLMAEAIERIDSFARSIREARFTDVVLLGMGGSSLAPEVLRAILYDQGIPAGGPRFQVLDSTDPAAVRAAATPASTTLYILASKSGTTIEPNTLAAYFQRVLERTPVPRWTDHFVAITDEGTALAERARAERFRELFINPSDIGGRYSALSFFGLVPAALMGWDISALVGWALAMLKASEPGADDALANPSVALGLAMGAAARAGRDKLTLLLPPELQSFGLWVEQLVAESTGKRGTGIVPIAGEPPLDPAAYGADRLFAWLRLPGSRREAADEARAGAAQAAGLPIIDIEMPERSAIGAEFVRWEIATAVAGALLDINPFDEPNVQQAKDATRGLLDRYRSSRRLSWPAPDLTADDRVTFTLSQAARHRLGPLPADALLTLLQGGEYFSLLAYLGPDPELAAALERLRAAVCRRTHAATMLGYGPRYLHSTGQLHKGGPNTGVFVLVSATAADDVEIPGESFSFGTLELAQALGDFASLGSTGRRALHVHLPRPDPRLVDRVAGALLAPLPAVLPSAS